MSMTPATAPATAPTRTDSSLPARRLQLLVGVAALSVTAFSLTGIAALTGLLPTAPSAQAGPLASVPQAAAAAQSQAVPPMPVAQAPVASSRSPVQGPQAAVDPAGTGGGGLAAAASAHSPAQPVTPQATPQTTHRAVPPAASRAASQAPRRAPAAAPVSLDAMPSDWPTGRADRMRVAEAADMGTVESVRTVAQPAASTGLGAIGGGVLGGVLGSRIGKGNGRTAMAAIGAIGGGLLGHQVEQRVRATRAYDVTLRMDDGSRRTVRYEQDPGLRVGERVRAGDGAAPSARGRLPAAEPSIVQVGAPA